MGIGYNAFNLDNFKFLGLEMSGSQVLARISESEGFLGDRATYTQDEAQVHGLLERTVETIRAGDSGRKIRKNYEQLLAAFNAIRTYKAQNGIPLDVKNPCV
ncbi:MAG TPA: hypothetical protein VE732_02305 [Nitrososphaera sp.]|jgi:hypothetical protein|nr:hypothetical protein [Nitrososphaera sp.]